MCTHQPCIDNALPAGRATPRNLNKADWLHQIMAQCWAKLTAPRLAPPPAIEPEPMSHEEYLERIGAQERLEAMRDAFASRHFL